VLFPLVYPLSQLLLGTIRLVPTPRYFPLRLHCVRMLNELQWSCKAYVPVAPLLLEVLQHSMFKKRPSGSAKHPINMWLTLKLAASALDTRAAQDAIIKDTVELLHDFLKCHSHTVAFPELATPVLVQLKRYSKTTKVPAWRSSAKAVVDACGRQAVLVCDERSRLETGPNDVAAVEGFMAQAARAARVAWAKAHTERQKRLEASIAPDASLAVTEEPKRKNKWQKAKEKKKKAAAAAAAAAEEGAGSDSDADGAGSGSDSDDGASSRTKRKQKTKAKGDAKQGKKKRRRRKAPREEVLAEAGDDTLTTLNLSDLED